MPSCCARPWRTRISSASTQPRRGACLACCLWLPERTFGQTVSATCPCMVRLANRDGTPRHDTPHPVLALGKVRHVGQPVALVVAETLTAARDAAEAIDVEYDPLPAITEAKDAISPGAPQLFDHISSNIVFDWDNDMGDAKATDAAFSRAARVVTLELVNNRVV